MYVIFYMKTNYAQCNIFVCFCRFSSYIGSKQIVIEDKYVCNLYVFTDACRLIKYLYRFLNNPSMETQ